jgi:hypothetical protein
MKCPRCGTWARVLETREKPENQTYRRYECANLHRFSTMESVKSAADKTKAVTHCVQNVGSLSMNGSFRPNDFCCAGFPNTLQAEPGQTYPR